MTRMVVGIALLGRIAVSATIEGAIRDSQARPVPGASVSLRNGDTVSSTQADADGKYRFTEIREGKYTLRAEMSGYSGAMLGPFDIEGREVKHVDLTLAAVAEFSDEPNFVVAGVADGNARGGHGSEPVARSTEALTGAAAALVKEPATAASVEHDPSVGELHHSLADALEKRGNSLEAVREYQRAAELNASENNLFDWGAELLNHRATDPAIEVFAKGNRLFPRSVRMLLGLGAALVARGSYDEAARRFFEAADLNPGDPVPYQFLGKVQNIEITRLDGFLQRLARFAKLQPENALANYDYAVALWSRRQASAQVQSLLEKAVRLDPKMGDAWLQLGILYSDTGNLPKAVSCYRKAIDTGTTREEAHYRLAQAYQRSGEKQKAAKEFDLYQQLRKASAAEEERKRNEMQQFVFALRDR